MGIYDGLDDKIKKHNDEKNNEAKENKEKEKALSELKSKMKPLVVEGIDGFVEMAIKVGISPGKVKKDLFFIPEIMPVKIWWIHPKYVITRNRKIYSYVRSVQRVSKKSLINDIIDHIIKSKEMDYSYRKASDIRNWDYENAVKKYFQERLGIL